MAGPLSVRRRCGDRWCGRIVCLPASRRSLGLKSSAGAQFWCLGRRYQLYPQIAERLHIRKPQAPPSRRPCQPRMAIRLWWLRWSRILPRLPQSSLPWLLFRCPRARSWPLRMNLLLDLSRNTQQQSPPSPRWSRWWRPRCLFWAGTRGLPILCAGTGCRALPRHFRKRFMDRSSAPSRCCSFSPSRLQRGSTRTTSSRTSGSASSRWPCRAGLRVRPPSPSFPRGLRRSWPALLVESRQVSFRNQASGLRLCLCLEWLHSSW